MPDGTQVPYTLYPDAGSGAFIVFSDKTPLDRQREVLLKMKIQVWHPIWVPFGILMVLMPFVDHYIAPLEAMGWFLLLCAESFVYWLFIRMNWFFRRAELFEAIRNSLGILKEKEEEKEVAA